MSRKSRPRTVEVSADARKALEVCGIKAAELVEAWLEEPDELLVLTRGPNVVVLVFEERGVLQLGTPADVRRTLTGE